MGKKCMESLLSSPPAELINPIYNHQYCSTYNFEYCLFEGKIYYRTCTPDDPKELIRGDLVPAKDRSDALNWKLFDGIGVPYDKRMKPLLAAGEEIVEISVSSDNIIAVTNLDRVYLFKPTEKNRPLCWESLLGAPDIFRNKLYLPHDRRGWDSSCSVCDKPEERFTNFINPKEKVTFFSDAHGVNFDFGFTLTIYVLSADGLKITYWDTGLPPSFSRGFLVPDGLQGVSISTAGSTVFLSAVDSTGKLHYYTRMIDYEINGACPGLKVTYIDSPVVYPAGDPGGSFFLGQGVRQMPLNGWQEHKVDNIPGDISDKICIRLIGQGDSARELRIQAQHPEQGWGYYSKKITKSNWKFIPDPRTAAANQPMVSEPIFDPAIPETSKFSYSSETLLDSSTTLSLEGFNPFLTDAEPFYINVSCPGEPTQSLKVHAVDAWGLHYHHKHDEDLMGSVDGEPKALVGTLIFSREQLELTQNPDSQIGRYLRTHFLAFHGKTKIIPIIADNSMVTLEMGHIPLHFTRQLSEAEIDYSYYVKKAMSSKLIAIPTTHEECGKLIELNKQCLRKIKTTHLGRRVEDGKYTVLNKNVSFMRSLTSVFFKVLFKPEDPTYDQAVRDLKLLLKVHKKATAYSALGKNHAVGYEKALVTLKTRIKNLEKMQDKSFENDLHHHFEHGY